MKRLRFLPSILAASFLLLSLNAARTTAAEGAAVENPGVAAAAEPDHIVTGPEIQDQINQKIHSEEADRQAIRDLLARPDVRRIAGSAGLDLKRADAAVGTLSGPELERLAAQARQVTSQIGGRESVTLTWTMLIIIVVALVVLIAVL